MLKIFNKVINRVRSTLHYGNKSEFLKGWDIHAIEMSARWDSNMEAPDKKFISAKLVGVANQPHVESILEIGAGAGHWTHLINEKVYMGRYLNVDVSKEMVRLFRQNHPGLPVVVQSAFEASFAECSFDLIVMIDVLRHNNSYRELAGRVGQWGKEVFIADWFGLGMQGKGAYNISGKYGVNFMSVAEILAAMEKSGFSEFKVCNVPESLEGKKYIIHCKKVSGLAGARSVS